MPAPWTGRRSALFHHAHADWRGHLILPGPHHRCRLTSRRGERLHQRHGGTSLRSAEVGSAIDSTDNERMSAITRRRFGQVVTASAVAGVSLPLSHTRANRLSAIPWAPPAPHPLQFPPKFV